METKEKIIKVAFNLFSQKGYEAVSLKQIVDAIGLTKGAFYHHFTGKEDLFRQIIETFLYESAEEVYKGLPKDNLKQFMMSCLERFMTFMNKMQQEMHDKNEDMGMSIFQLSSDGLRLFPDFSGKILETHENERKVWIEVIKNAKKSGEISTSITDRQLAKMFISVIDGRGMQMMLEAQYDNLHGEIFTLWNALYNLIKT